jgi:ABC-2 type transport system ATP-binding protein
VSCDVPLIEAVEVSIGYRRRLVFDQASFALSGRVVGLLGPNGAGKTTLLNAAATLLRLRGGVLRVAGTDLSSPDGVKTAHQQVALVPQRFGYHPGFTVDQFTQYTGWLKGLSGTELKNRTTRALEQVDLINQRNQKMGALSGGMLRRAGIASALVSKAKLIIMDEPTAGLDPEQRLHFRAVIEELSSQRSFILSTHLVEDVTALADQVAIIHKGKCLFNGPTQQLAEHGAGDLDLGYVHLIHQTGTGELP